MLDIIKNITNVTYTENGAVSNASTFEPCLDFFAVSGALRNAEDKRVLELFVRAFATSPDYALRALFYTRDIRGGVGERRAFRIILRWLANMFPETVIKNIDNISEYGRYDDMLELFDTPCQKAMVEYIKKVLEADEEKMLHGESVSLLSKWLPSINASNYERKKQAQLLAKLLGMTEKTYRQKLSALKKYLDILERRLCEKDYSFEYEKQPSKALYKYRRAFIRNDEDRYLKYIDLVKDGKTQLNAKTLYPYEIIRDAIKPGLLKNDIDVLDTTWKNLPNFCDGRNAIAVIDGSGSMVGTPLNIATSLGIYFAERNRGYFHNHFITFSKNPKLVKIHGNTIVDKAEYCMSYNEIANTDLIKVFGLILKAAIKNNLPQSELPETIYVISDMEFDAGVCDNISLHEEVKELFEKHGYILPNIVYWNVDSRNNQYPVKANEYGCVLVSGASPSVFKMVISQEISPLKFMLSVLDSERYSKICA